MGMKMNSAKMPYSTPESPVVFGEPKRRERLIGPHEPALEVFLNDELL
jgi:hypothetical protein